MLIVLGLQGRRRDELRRLRPAVIVDHPADSVIEQDVFGNAGRIVDEYQRYRDEILRLLNREERFVYFDLGAVDLLSSRPTVESKYLVVPSEVRERQPLVIPGLVDENRCADSLDVAAWDRSRFDLLAIVVFDFR